MSKPEENNKSKENKSKENKNQFLKYYLDKSLIVWKSILSVFSIIIYIILQYIENTLTLEYFKDTLEAEKAAEIKTYLSWINIGESFVVLILSVFVSSLILSFMTVKENNQICSKFLTTDFFSSKDFYLALSKENQEAILELINQHRFFDGSKVKSQVYAQLRDKINDLCNSNIYYSNCYLDINCYIYNDTIVKKVTKTLYIKPLQENAKVEVNDYSIVTSAHKNDGTPKYGLNKDSIELIIDNDIIDNSLIQEKPRILPSFDKKAGYNECKTIYYTERIELDPKKECKLVVHYETTVPITDLSYVFRMDHLCQSYTLHFTIIPENGKDYVIDTAAFGFIEDGSSIASQRDNGLSAIVSFNNWIFPLDGVSISILEKN